MALSERIDSDIKEAMKSGQKLRLETLRMLKSALKYKQIDSGASLADEDVIAVVGTLSKQRRDSIEQFRKAGREDLAQKEEEELGILAAYLPKQLTAEELAPVIDEAIKESGAAGPQDLGKVMKIIMPKVKGAVDGKLLNEKIREKLASIGGPK